MNHDFFGKILFMGGETPEEDDYWECELKIEGYSKPICVLITAGIDGPSQKHVDFFKEIISNLDNLFKRCWPIFEPDFEEWTRKTFCGNWKDDFELDGLQIPKDGNINNEWDVCYFVNAAGHYFTAYFKNGNPIYNEIDG